MRIILTENPLAPSYAPPASFGAAARLASGRPVWIAPAEPGVPPEVLAYRLRFTVDEAAPARIHVSADERYELWFDGERLGRGPERGSARAWFYETYELALTPGDHVLVARVWRLGQLAPLAQVSLAPGFLLAAEPPFVELLATGAAPWEVKRLDGYSFTSSQHGRHAAWFSGPNQTTDAAHFPWGVEEGAGAGWGPVVPRMEDAGAFFGIASVHPLVPAMLPEQIAAPRTAGVVRYVAASEWDDPQVVAVTPGKNSTAEVTSWQELVDGTASMTIPPNTRRQIVIDLGRYTCAYPELVTSGGAGATVTIGWAEALFQEPEGRTKGQRDQVEGRYFISLMRDTFRPDGGENRRFTSLWWRAGRFVQLLVATGGEPLTITSFGMEETRYPLEMESRLATSDGRLDQVLPILLRGLQMCAHETYMDCPYYEQLMYAGDTRLESLITYAITRDDRLPRKALRLFDLSRLPSGETQARYPSRDVQVIPPFALWWVAMVHDFALWRDDQAFVRSLLSGVRAVLNGFIDLLDDERLLVAPPGWNFTDWVPGWRLGNPPDAASGTSGLLNWHLIYTLNLAAQLEEWVGEPEFAGSFARHRDRLATQVTRRFWDEERGLFADDRSREHFSEHTQCLALLSGMVDATRHARVAHGLLSDPRLTRTTIYFSHYLFETYRILDRADALFDRLQLWFDLPEQGFTTTPEQPEPSRSDCHGWGAHPLFHSFATLLGVRPASPGFSTVEITPLLGPLESMTGSLVHPRGQIDVQLRVQAGRLAGSIRLPAGITGTLRYADASQPLGSGLQQIDLEPATDD